MPLLCRRSKLRDAARETKVWLANVAVEVMLVEAASLAPLETGGMVLGYISPNTTPEELMVQAVLGPGPHSRHSQSRFEPDGHWQQHQLARHYEESGRITTYLGDWHTHPGGVAVPSRRDERTARAIARSKDARMSRPLMLILGSAARDDEQDEWNLAVYRWTKLGLKPVEAEVLNG